MYFVTIVMKWKMLMYITRKIRRNEQNKVPPYRTQKKNEKKKYMNEKMLRRKIILLFPAFGFPNL